MIFYFSGTGNSRWAAQRLAELTGDEACDIAGLAGAPDLAGEKQVGLVFPIYAWGAPEPVLAFARAVAAPPEAFTFGVCTCGSEAGLAMKKLAAVFPLDSAYSVVMPNNYVIGSDVDGGEEARRKLGAAGAALEQAAREIAGRVQTNRVHEGALAALKSGPVNFGFNRFARGTKPFWTTDACTGCGLCAERCPAKVIALTDGRPVWSGACYQCLRCINECPARAIEYGKTTAGRERYTADRYL